MHDTMDMLHSVTYDQVRYYPSEEYSNPDTSLFAYFPNLEENRPDVEHGFQWAAPPDGSGVNVSFAREKSGIDITHEESVRVLGRTQRALNALYLGDMRDAIIAVPDPNDTTIEIIRSIDDLKKYRHTPRGYEVKASAVFCSSNLARTIYAGGADCAWTMLVTDAQDGQPDWYGLAHTGRYQVAQGFPAEVVERLKAENFPADKIYGAMVPSLEQEHHELQERDTESSLGSVALWQGFIKHDTETGSIYPDVAGKATADFIGAGMAPDHFERYLAGTYEASANGYPVSHRYARATGTRPSSFIVCIRAGKLPKAR